MPKKQTTKTKPVKKAVVKKAAVKKPIEKKSKEAIQPDFVKADKKVKKASQPISLPVVDIKGVKVGTVSVSSEYFSQPMNKALIAQAVRVYLANQRQGGAHTKTRGEVAGSGKKIWRQKGTGRARHGDRYSPIFVGGGISHGPRTRDFSLKMSKKMRKRALQVALSESFRSNAVIIVDDFQTIKGKTGVLMQTLSKLSCKTHHKNLQEKVLMAIESSDKQVLQAGRNIKSLTIRPVSSLTAYEVYYTKKLIFSREGIKKLTI
jgi:large subunit ribosomal protein L4